MPDPGIMVRTTVNSDPMDYSQSLLVKQAAARAKELVVEKQIISIKQQIELSADEEREAILDEQKDRARYTLENENCAHPISVPHLSRASVFAAVYVLSV